MTAQIQCSSCSASIPANSRNTPARIEAAALGGKPLSFYVTDTTQSPPSEPQQGPLIAASVVLLLVFGSVVLLVRRNLRLGRGDRRGAKRLVIVNIIGFAVYWLFTAHHRTTAELSLIAKGIVGALVTSLLFWSSYIALEPLVRRRWPRILISWSRLLSGEWRDPLVGREILIGCLVGVVFISNSLKLGQENVSSSMNYGSRIGMFFGYLANAFPATIAALGVLCLLCIFQFILRNEIAAIVLSVLAAALLSFPASWSNFVMNLVIMSLSMLVLRQFGLLALAVAWIVGATFGAAPMSLDTGAWYSTAGFAAIALFFGLALFGFFTSVGGRPILTLGSDD